MLLKIYTSNLSNHHSRKYSSDSLVKRTLLEFPKTFCQNTFSLNEQESHCLWDFGRDVFFMQEIRSITERLRSMMPDRLTFSGNFVSIWSVRVADWSVTLVGLNVISSGKCVKQNPKYNLVRGGISLLIVFADLCLKISLSLGCKFISTSPRRKHSWDSKTLVLLKVSSRQFTFSFTF